MSLLNVNTRSFFVFIFGFVLPFCVYGQNTKCDDENECEGDDIDITGTAYCRGYYACEDATIDSSIAYCSGNKACYDAVKITTSDNAYCFGYRGCYQTVLVSSESVYCNGLQGCYHAEVDSESYTYCRGDRACAYSTMQAGNTTYANGRYAGMYANISGTPTVYSYGYFGLTYGTITDDGVDSLGVYLYGWKSGYELDIICESGECYCHCSSNGCLNTDITCDGDCSLHITCSDCTDYPSLSTDYDDEIWDKYQNEKKLLKENMKNKLLEFENEYNDDEQDEQDKQDIKERDMNKYMKQFDDQFIQLRRKYGIKNRHNEKEGQLIVDNIVNKEKWNLNFNSSFSIGMICLTFTLLFGIIIYQCYIIDKNRKDSKYINIA